MHFIGLPEDTTEIIGALDMFWHSHLHKSVPNGMLSAMAAGVPVVSVLGEETESLIVHQTTGLGVNLGARDEFARWTKYLIEQPDAARQLSEQGRSHVQRLSPVDTFVESHIAEYEQICAVTRLKPVG